MFLKIENAGVAPVESFTVLGVSTARGNREKIGQFGTGAKHAINILLRDGINPVICCGSDKLEFFTKPERMGADRVFNRVYAKVKAKTLQMGWSDEFGELDWTSTDMALREFISNAIDASPDAYNIDIVDNPRASRDKTRVYIPLTQSVQKYFNNISKHFLHFTDKNNRTFIVKSEESPANIYRKGVFVRQLPDRVGNSLYDYNLGEDLKIDETRNLDDYAAQGVIAKRIVRDESVMCSVFLSMASDKPAFECDLSSFWMDCDADLEKVASAWKLAHGNLIACRNNAIDTQFAANKGLKVAVLKCSDKWYTILKKAGVRTIEDKMCDIEKQGHVKIDTTEKAQNTFDKVWDCVVELGIHKGKVKPKLEMYLSQKEGNSETFGQCDIENGIIYLSKEAESNIRVVLHELGHYISGSPDDTRDFTDWFCRACAILMELVFDI